VSEYDEVMKQLGRYSCNEHAEPVDDCIACEAWLDTLNAGVLLQKYHDALKNISFGNTEGMFCEDYANKVLESEG